MTPRHPVSGKFIPADEATVMTAAMAAAEQRGEDRRAGYEASAVAGHIGDPGIMLANPGACFEPGDPA